MTPIDYLPESSFTSRVTFGDNDVAYTATDSLIFRLVDKRRTPRSLEPEYLVEYVDGHKHGIRASKLQEYRTYIDSCVSDSERLPPRQLDQLERVGADSQTFQGAVELSSLVTNPGALAPSDTFEKYKDFLRLFQASFKMFALEQTTFDRSSEDDLPATHTPPPNSDDKAKSVAPSIPRAPIVLDAEAVKRLDHVDLSAEAKKAYLQLRSSKSCQRWVESFQSLPVWSRYAWIWYGHYGEAGYVVDQSANHPKSGLSRAKKAWLLLGGDLYRMERHSVFQ
ncbi:hypothetical protein H310_15077 [Aphanomyces invadans]|uniref:Uncharacterized protein n=1 Tax=Aphanomyces invadans TaxID=157072 RepID=A0A024T9S2_9STRA|nr:hypothetical protein H310_15077 [Aphanomyces invadans]ETV90092.1 hypothetical protein H310_15077 [Aphanomyces invadans]|eukprot:XP_008881277.1 hypothetical protein H310_15077 [Aphanomyces invadans]